MTTNFPYSKERLGKQAVNSIN